MSNKFIYRINFILILYICNNVYPQTVVTDTIYSIDSLDGGICYFYEDDIYSVIQGTMDSAGDGYNAFLWMWQYCRAYYSFPISSIPYDSANFELISATLQIYQLNSYGNDERGVYPIWDFPGGDTNFCYLDHVNYGDSLWFDDWTAGDEGDAQTLTSLYSIVSSTPDTGFRNINVTSLVETDLVDNRNHTQFRIHFPIGTDYDYYMDLLFFSEGGITFYNRRPKIIIQYQIETVNIDENPNGITNDFLLHQNYPNPFNPLTNITVEIPFTSDVELIVFDLMGKVVTVLVKEHLDPGRHFIIWNGRDDSGKAVSSGIYFYQIVAKNGSKGVFIQNRKMVLLR